MRLIFENELGSFEMTGGGDAEIRVTKINGIGVQPYERQLLTSYDFDGAAESARRFPARSITVAGDIMNGSRRVAELMRILSEPCRMVLSGSGIERAIQVSAAEAEFGSRNGPYMSFALSLACDDPYFYDTEETVCGLFVRNKLINAQTVLPAVFSTRVNEADVEVNGDRAVEPVIEILGGEAKEGDGSIAVENLTDAKVFTIDYVPKKDECITIDIANRTITSDIEGNIIKYISDDSFMSDLVIENNKTRLRAIGYGATGTMSAYIRYKNKYIEAFI